MKILRKLRERDVDLYKSECLIRTKLHLKSGDVILTTIKRKISTCEGTFSGYETGVRNLTLDTFDLVHYQRMPYDVAHNLIVMLLAKGRDVATTNNILTWLSER